MKQKYYKAVSLKRLSHYDHKTKWRVGSIVRPDFVDIENSQLCGHGIHVSPTLLDAVSYQTAPSRYYEVEPIEIIAEDNTKSRCTAVNVIREIGKEEQDKLAGFKLYEANHSVNPLLLRNRKVTPVDIENLKKWDSRWDSVGNSVRDSVGDSRWASVWDSVGNSVGNSVWDSVWDSVGDSVGDSVWAYIGGLFPNITKWKYAESLGADPWRPLLDLWYRGFVLSFDGITWRLHQDKDAKIVYEWRKQ
jgi:hypothetical protein